MTVFWLEEYLDEPINLRHPEGYVGSQVRSLNLECDKYTKHFFQRIEPQQT